MLTVVGGTRHVRAQTLDHQTILFEATEAEDRGERAGALVAQLAVGIYFTAAVGMAENQYTDGFVTLQQLGHAAQRAEGGRQHHMRTIRVERTLNRRGDHQQVFPALELEVGALDGFAHLRLVHIQPGLSDCRWRHGDDFRCRLFGLFEQAAAANQDTQGNGESSVGEHRESTS